MNSRRPLILPFFLLLAVFLCAQDRIHVLKKGETLYSVARIYGVEYQELLRINKIDDPHKLQVGQKITIPGKPPAPPPDASAAGDTMPDDGGKPASSATITHKVAKDETLYGIARRYGVAVGKIRTLNGLDERAVLKVGAVLRIPVSGTSPATTTSTTVAPPTATKHVDARPTQSKKVDPAIRWPVSARQVAYLTGKLYGVMIGTEKSEPVRSLSRGTVVSAGPYRGFGQVAIVQAENGYVYVYGGCDLLSVKEGDLVSPGLELGEVGVDSLSGKPQLFFLVYKDNVAIDPALAPRV